MNIMFLGYIVKHPEACATAVVGLGLLWNERSGRQEIKDDFGTKLDVATADLGTKIDIAFGTKLDRFAAELKLESQHTQSIVLGTAYATMKAISGSLNIQGHVLLLSPVWVSCG